MKAGMIAEPETMSGLYVFVTDFPDGSFRIDIPHTASRAALVAPRYADTLSAVVLVRPIPGLSDQEGVMVSLVCEPGTPFRFMAEGDLN